MITAEFYVQNLIYLNTMKKINREGIKPLILYARIFQRLNWSSVHYEFCQKMYVE